ncbi:MAG: YceI family protein [Bacteroidota bacterium]
MIEVYKFKINKIRAISLLFAILIVFLKIQYSDAQTRYYAKDGKIKFESDAPLELISAHTEKVLGIIDVDKNVFAISIPVASFKGFNSSLQREHFNENYMETEKFPKGIFKGSIIDKVDLKKNGFYKVMTEGKLLLHGVEKSRKIPCEIIVRDGVITVKSNFKVQLVDHKIKIPTVVRQKISESIFIDLNSNFVLKK